MKKTTLNARITEYNKKHSTEKKSVKEIVFGQLAELGYNVKNWDDVKKIAATVTSKPRNYITGREYSGVNLLLLEDGEYMTWNQIQNLGVKVKKGAKSYIVCYCQPESIKTTSDENGEETTEILAPVLKYYRVFNTCDIDGLPNTNTEPVYGDEFINDLIAMQNEKVAI